MGRLRVGDETLTVPKHGGVLVGPDQLRQVFNDTETDVLWLIVGAPEEPESLPGANTDMSLFDPVDPKQLPKELAGNFGKSPKIKFLATGRVFTTEITEVTKSELKEDLAYFVSFVV